MPESISAWKHFPAWTVTVGQSVICGMVMVSLLGSPLHVCELGEGPFSLNHPPSHYPAHLSYSILREGHQL